MSQTHESFLASLDALLRTGQDAFAAAERATLEEHRLEFFGRRNGRLKEAQLTLCEFDIAERLVVEKRFNEVIRALETAYVQARDRLSR